MSSVDLWAELEGEPGTSGRARRRIFPSSSRDLFIELDLANRRRMLTYERASTSDVATLPIDSTSAVHVSVSTRQHEGINHLSVSVILEDDALKGVFTRMVEDLADTAVSATDDDSALVALVGRIVEWQQLLHHLRKDGLSHSERRGLVGELWVLRDIVLQAVGADEAIAAWTGPLRANQDIQLATCAVEVKSTTALQPQGMTVNNEREFEAPEGTRLLLAHLSLDERRDVGETLLDLIADVRRVVAGAPAARSRFDLLLGRVGFVDDQNVLYREPHYSLRSARFYEVRDGFPRIRESDLMEGIGQVTYRVSLAACEAFEIECDEVTELIERGTTGL